MRSRLKLAGFVAEIAGHEAPSPVPDEPPICPPAPPAPPLPPSGEAGPPTPVEEHATATTKGAVRAPAAKTFRAHIATPLRAAIILNSWRGGPFNRRSHEKTSR